MHKEAIQSSQQGFYQRIDNVVLQFCFSREISFIRDGLTYEGWRLIKIQLHISSTIIVDCPGMLSQRDDSPLVGFTRPTRIESRGWAFIQNPFFHAISLFRLTRT